MSQRRDTPRILMHALASRLEERDDCAEHSLDEAQPLVCPFCADREVMMRYERFIHGK